MNNLLTWIKSRLAEGSTHNGIAILSLLLPSIVPPQYQALLPFVTAFFAALGVALPDKSTLSPAQASASIAAFIPPVHIAANPAIADAINAGVQMGVQTAITRLLTPPAKV